jgi:alpha-glucuronidase
MIKDPSYTAWLTGFAGGGSVTVKADGGVPDRIIGELERVDFSSAGTGAASAELRFDETLDPEGYSISCGYNNAVIAGGGCAGLLYGVYALDRFLRSGVRFSDIAYESAPVVKCRALNHWDNMDGSVERGYAGQSLFFKDGSLSYVPARIEDYARLLASVGINRVCLNNVNVTPQAAELITEKHLPELKKLAALFERFYIRLIIAVEFSAPIGIGGLSTCDPLNKAVSEWWARQAELVYGQIPDLDGFLVKADSEFRTGPAALGRTQADGANVIAEALKPFGGVVYWRCFVYDCRQDWRDAKTDRPKAAYAHFKPLDGKFRDNVILQIKNGPMDFQVREPNSPLLGAMEKTRQGVEFQITGEYTGQQVDLYAHATQWEEFFRSKAAKGKTMADLFPDKVDSICAVANTGDSPCWTGNPLAQANLYAYGRMSWDVRLSAEKILKEWAGLTFGNNGEVVRAVTDILLKSRETYEKYNAPLGIGWMVNINHHYGPSVDGYEYMRWGTYHRANHTHIGVDRTASGTGYTAQYDEELAALYDDKDACPEDLLLFFHRMPFDHVLRNGKTIIQHIYDTHFEGAEDVEKFIEVFDGLKPLLPEGYFNEARGRLLRQLDNAKEWRDVINTYFYRLTAVGDERGRKIYD